jgi:hypothetical protein
MMPVKFVDRSGEQRLRMNASAAAVIFVSVAFGYGIAKAPERTSFASGAVAVAAQPRHAPSGDRGGYSAARVAHLSRDFALAQPGSRIDGSRECALDRGIADDCIFE